MIFPGSLIAPFAAAAALAAPTIGARLPGEARARPITFLDGKLRPIAGRPIMPAATRRVELSPDGTQVLAQVGRQLRFYRVHGGKQLRRVRLDRAPAALSWMTSRQLVVVSRSSTGDAVVQSLNPRTRTLTHGQAIDGRLRDSAPFEGFQLVLTSVARDGPKRVAVVTPDGAVKHTIELAGLKRLNGALLLFPWVR